MKQLERKDLLEFESVKNWFDSLTRSAKRNGRDGLSKSVKSMRLGRMWEFTNEGKLNPDELLKEAKEDVNLTGKRLEDYFYAKKKVTSHNTALTSVSYLRGFFSHNNIIFPRSMALPKKEEAKVATKDTKTSFYDFDEETKEFVFKNGEIKYFMQNLPFRDQVIALGLLSTGADTKDLLNLNVGFVKDEKGQLCTKKRFFWLGKRAKTGQPFRTFFSEEATLNLKRYVEQERAEAKDDEPLFVAQKREYTISQGQYKGKKVTVSERLTTHAVSMSFRSSAKTLGYAKKRGEANPFRPKRFRHLFRTACAIAEIDKDYIKAMMGHTSDISGDYTEKDPAIFKKVYLKVEPFLTVFAGGDNRTKKEVIELKNDFTKYSQRTLKLEAKVEDLNEQLKSATELVYSFEPVLSTFSAIANTKEGQELINKIREAKIRQEMKEAQKETDKLRAKITAENPIPEKRNKVPTVKEIKRE